MCSALFSVSSRSEVFVLASFSGAKFIMLIVSSVQCGTCCFAVAVSLIAVMRMSWTCDVCVQWVVGSQYQSQIMPCWGNWTLPTQDTSDTQNLYRSVRTLIASNLSYTCSHGMGRSVPIINVFGTGTECRGFIMSGIDVINIRKKWKTL